MGLRHRFVWAFALTVGAGCSEDPVATRTLAPRFSEIQREVLSGCAQPSCHGGNAGGLSLIPAEAYHELLNEPITNDAARARLAARVKAGVPDSSFLLVKLTEPAAGEGSRMPERLDPIPQYQIDAIREWIRLGAKND